LANGSDGYEQTATESVSAIGNLFVPNDTTNGSGDDSLPSRPPTSLLLDRTVSLTGIACVKGKSAEAYVSA
jgi:hypothetical protein